ncbi:MAG: hypothetical protein IJR29_09040 [Butyrivibrio sp.]|nr:hypothetical protein [Butyrivibrio sp.]
MKKEQKTISKYDCAICVVLSIVTLFSMIIRIFYGWDQDQSYLILLSSLIAEGKVLLRDILDLHQLGAVIPSLFCKIYLFLAGSYEGVAVFLRCISLLCQIFVSMITFHFLRKKYSFRIAFLSAVVVANMLPRASLLLEYSTIAIWALLVVDLLLIEIYYKRNIWRNTILSAILYSLAVFSYPTMLITAPFYFGVMLFVFGWNHHGKIRYVITFGLVCVLFAGIFIAYEFCNMDVTHFLTVLNAIGENGDHAVMFSAFTHIGTLLKSILRVTVTVLIAVFITLLSRMLLKRSYNVFFVYIFVTTLAVIFLNLTGIRPSGPYGFLERYIGVVLLALISFKTVEDRAVKVLLLLLGATVFVGAIMGSNLGINENAMYLEISVVAAIIIAGEYLEKNDSKSMAQWIFLIFFVFGIVFLAGYFVRVNYTEPANFTDCTEKFENGPLKGIYVKKEYKDEIEKGSIAISEITENGKTYALLGNEAIYNFYVNGEIIAPGFAPTTKYNKQWIIYYTDLEKELPDVLLLNTYWFPNVIDFYETEFGEYVRDKYILENTEFDDIFLKLVRIE